MCPEVFHLGRDEFRILKYLALYGPINLTQLSKHTTKYALGLDRWGVKKRLDGTTRFIGLIPNEYVIEEQTKLHRYNKQEKRYWLTVKGIIAATAVVPLKQNQLFRHYSWMISKGVNNKKIRTFVEDAIEEYMRLIVSWHYLQGFELTKQKSSKFYYIEFIEHIRNVNGIDITISDKEIDEEFIKIVKNCIAYYTVIDLLTGGELHFFKVTLSLVDWEKTPEFSDEKTYYWYSKIWEWSLHLGDPNFHDSVLRKNMTSTNEIRNAVAIDEVYSIDIKKKVNSILKRINYNKNGRLKA